MRGYFLKVVLFSICLRHVGTCDYWVMLYFVLVSVEGQYFVKIWRSTFGVYAVSVIG
jgi:hypothetical protein